MTRVAPPRQGDTLEISLGPSTVKVFTKAVQCASRIGATTPLGSGATLPLQAGKAPRSSYAARSGDAPGARDGQTLSS